MCLCIGFVSKRAEIEESAIEITGNWDQELSASQYFIYDLEKDRFLLLSGQADEKIYPASITKLFTGYVALQYLEPDQVLTVGDELDLLTAGSSVAGLRKGDRLTVSQLVEAMLLPSGNDAAYVLAAAAGRKICEDRVVRTNFAVDVFVDEMNEQMQHLGMTGSHFDNPDGIHSGSHYSTFADLAILAEIAVESEMIMKNAAVGSDTVNFVERGAYVGEGEKENLGNTVQWKNTNELVNPESEYYSPYATGLKTGQTSYAGSCLLSSFDYAGKIYIIGVFGCPEQNGRFVDTLRLFEETIRQSP